MRYFTWFAMIFLLFFADVAVSQTILKRVKKYVIIAIDESNGFGINDQVDVHKKLVSGHSQNVGKVKIILFKSGKCIGQIMSEKVESPIAAGDFISMETSYSETQSKYSAAEPASWAGTKSLSYLSLGIGIVASGLGYYFLDQANQTYKDYEAATSSQDAVDFFDKTIALDKKSKIGFGIGGGLIAIGLISYLMNQPRPQPKAGNSFSFQPVWKNDSVVMGVSFCFNHPARR